VALKWIVQLNAPLACASYKKPYMEEDLDLWSFTLTDEEMNTLTNVKMA
jgi:diketogulonate reductase-like aldo/keto reductase